MDRDKLAMLDKETSKEINKRVAPNDLADIILKDEQF